MNSFIETLNQWGGNFLNFAGTMLWQSSLLIAVLFALDFLFRRKIRASLRYALWLVVLLKLILPPTLALPTSPVWWLHQTPSAQTKLQFQNFTVNYGSQPLPEIPKNLSAFMPPKPKLAVSLWLLVISISVSVALFAWLLIRWWQIARQARRAKTSERLTTLANEARQFAGIKSNPPVKLTANTMSPAVCGLFRPVILIPQSLAENFSDEQLRAVLLHELIHLRRRDVWVNFLQSLLQIFYWWQPLVWLANARIRRVREEAVDDAVMLALRGEAETYAPTLLEVAKLALNRPLASLGLVGILESRSALRQRIERLLNFRAPKKAGLTLVSIFGILAFTAVAVPMGEAPTSSSDQFSSDAISPEKTLTLKVNPEVFIRNVKAQADWRLHASTDDYTKILLDILRSETVDCTPPHGIAFNTKTGEITMRNTPEQLEIFRQVIGQLNRADGKYELSEFSTIHRKIILIEASCFWMNSDELEKLAADLHFEHAKNNNMSDWTISPGQFDEINQRIKSLDLRPFLRPRIQTSHGVTAEFFCGTKTNGVEFDCVPFVVDGGIDLAFRTQVTGNPSDNGQTLIGTNRYKIHGETGVENHGGIIISAKTSGASPTNLVMVIGVQLVTNQAITNGLALRSDNNAMKPQIHIKARFFEVPKGVIIDMTNLETLRAQASVEELAEPEVTTTSGRQTEMRATKIITVITNFAYEALTNTGTGTAAVTPQTSQVETGPVFDVIPKVLDDGYTIDLRAIASATEFLGYDQPPTNAVGKYIKEADIHLPVILPSFSIQQSSFHLKLHDGQTLAMGLFPTHHIQSLNEKFPDVSSLARSYQSKSEPEKERIVFITATLVDSAGNRIHSDN